ncbi:ArsR/SmtB family transcription factor [Bifidobacterium mongoliense]|uniref:ArsR/SmtB family transcription factor n=1 Tax=Bifidobacterium mongoliense TaxID=518643 RepID=UPI00389B00B4
MSFPYMGPPLPYIPTLFQESVLKTLIVFTRSKHKDRNALDRAMIWPRRPHRAGDVGKEDPRMTTEETQRHLPDVFEVSDPRNVRIISHPIRYAALEELFERQRPLTATEIAAMVGVSPSVMSYHLRERGAIGIVHKTKAARDGRESPWVPSARHYSVAVSAAPGLARNRRIHRAVHGDPRVDARGGPGRETRDRRGVAAL